MPESNATIAVFLIVAPEDANSSPPANCALLARVSLAALKEDALTEFASQLC